MGRTERGFARRAAGPGTTAAVRVDPQPRRGRLEAGWRFGSVPGAASTAFRAGRDDSGRGRHGAWSGDLDGTAETNADQHRAFSGSFAQLTDARFRSVA